MKSMIQVFLILSIALGCASSKYNHIAPIDSLESSGRRGSLSRTLDISDGLSSTMDSLFSIILVESKIYKIALMGVYSNYDMSNDFEDKLGTIIRDIMRKKTAAKVKLVDPEIVRRNISDFDLKPTQEDVSQQNQIWQAIGVMIVFTCSWENLNENEIQVTIRAFDTESGVKLAELSKILTKNDRMRALIGEKLLGSLVIFSKDIDTKIFCDSKEYGEISGKWKIIDVPYGSHDIRIEKKGYQAFTQNIFMDEGNVQAIEVKFVEPSFAPSASFFASAVLPMSSAWIYGSKMEKGRFSVAFNITTSSLFYLSAAIALIDSDSKHYISGRKYSENVRKAELYSTIGFYSLNLFSGYLVGRDYKNFSRKGILIGKSYYLRSSHTPFEKNSTNIIYLSYYF